MKSSEVVFVGTGFGAYLMLLGGGYYDQQLNKIFQGWANLLVLTLLSDIVHPCIESVYKQ